MFTTAYQRNDSLTTQSRRNNRKPPVITAMTDSSSRISSRTDHLRAPIPPIRESLSVKSASNNSSASSRPRSHTNENLSSKPAQQIYTHSNPPRELQRRRTPSLRERVSSAPDEKSPRSRVNQPKSLSAKGSLTPPSQDNSRQSEYSTNDTSQIDQKVKDSLNALIKEQQKSNVPKAVQKRRILLLFPRSSPNEKANPFPPETPIINPPPSDNFEAEIADSMELAAILHQIQCQDDSDLLIPSSSSKSQTKSDPSKYEYVVANPLDTATYRLSPRTLKPIEELAARSRFSQYYRSEMRSSANAQIPSLLASIVTENTNTLGNGTDLQPTFTIKLNPPETINPPNFSDKNPSTGDDEVVELCYDATLKRFYDPHTGKYYELTSE